MIKKDKAQVTLLLDTQSPINELGKLEMKAQQAKREMNLLAKASKEYTKTVDRMKAMALAGKENSKAYQNAAEKLGKLKNAHNQYMLKKGEYDEMNVKVNTLRKSIGLAAMTLRQKTSYARHLSNELSNLTQGTLAYKQALEKLKRVNQSVKKQRNEINGANSAWSKLGREVKAFGVLALGFLGFQELIGQIQNMVRSLAVLSDKMADVQKTTGLTKGEVEGLTKSFSRMDTRTGRKELLGLAQIAGKLGVKGKQDIEGFVSAADKINIALGEDLGSDAENTLKQVGKLVDIFKVKQQFGLEKGLMKVGSAINSLGAASTASEGFLVDFTKRLGGIAPNANISIQQVLGLGATLDQLGQTSESSSTAMGQLLVALGQDIPGFAKIAGISVEEFSKTLQQDANQALISVIKGAKSTKHGLAGMAETLNKLNIDGSRAAAVVGVLSNNIELLKDQQHLANQEFEKGDSIINEFNVKNSTMAAKIEKIQKALARAFTDSSLGRGIEQIVNKMAGLIPPAETLQQRLSKVREEFNLDIKVLTEGNFSLEKRRKLIAKINERYEKYLPQLISEKDSLEEIHKIQKKVNDSLLSRIIILDYEKEIGQIYKDQKDAAEGLAITEEKRIRNQQKAFKYDMPASMQEGMEAVANTMDILNNAILDGTENRLEKTEQKYNKIADRLGLDFKRLKAQLQLDGDSADTDQTASKNQVSINTGKQDQKAKQEAEAILKRWKDFNKQMDEMNAISQLKMGEIDLSEIVRIDQKYEDLQNRLSEFLAAKLISQAEYHARKDALDAQHSQETAAFALQKNAELADLRKKDKDQRLQDEADFYEKLSQQQAEQQAKELAQQQQLMAAKAGLLSQFGALVQATNQLQAKEGSKFAAFQKELTLFQVSIDTAAAISKAIAGASAAAQAGGPAAPFLLAGYVTSMVATVVSGMAKAQKLLHDTPPNAPNASEQQESYTPFRRLATGGFTGDGLPFKDETGHRPAGIVHDGEYVVPKWLLSGNQYVANQVAMIEALRMRKGFAQGGAVATSAAAPSSAPALDSGLLLQVVSSIENLTQVVRNQQTQLRAIVSYTDYQDLQEYEQRVQQSEINSSL